MPPKNLMLEMHTKDHIYMVGKFTHLIGMKRKWNGSV